MLTQEELKRLLHYDPETGVFTRLVETNPRAKVGMTAGTNMGRYFEIKHNHIAYRAHHLAWLYVYGRYPKEGLVIDHIDGDGKNNRISNLRECSQSQNMQNIGLHSSNSSGYKGVYWNKKDKRFMAMARLNMKRIYLGSYKTAEEAYAAYVAFAKTEHGEFYRPSSPMRASR